MKKLFFFAMAVLLLCSCTKEIKNYRIYDDLLISFTEALGERKLKSEKLTKSEDGRIITQAEYTYKSDNPAEDMQNYLYYLLNNNEATLLDEDTAALDSENYDCAIMVDVTNTEDTFTIKLTRPKLTADE